MDPARSKPDWTLNRTHQQKSSRKFAQVHDFLKGMKHSVSCPPLFPTHSSVAKTITLGQMFYTGKFHNYGQNYSFSFTLSFICNMKKTYILSNSFVKTESGASMNILYQHLHTWLTAPPKDNGLRLNGATGGGRAGTTMVLYCVAYPTGYVGGSRHLHKHNWFKNVFIPCKKWSHYLNINYMHISISSWKYEALWYLMSWL